MVVNTQGHKVKESGEIEEAFWKYFTEIYSSPHPIATDLDGCVLATEAGL